MAILHHKEEKIQVVLGRLPKKYTHEQFVEMFIKLYSKDWGKIKAAYIKQSQDKESGIVINMPKPDLYLKQILDTYLIANPSKTEATKDELGKIEKTDVKVKPIENTESIKEVKKKTSTKKIAEDEKKIKTTKK